LTEGGTIEKEKTVDSEANILKIFVKGWTDLWFLTFISFHETKVKNHQWRGNYDKFNIVENGEYHSFIE
jgi:hypothetical protein